MPDNEKVKEKALISVLCHVMSLLEIKEHLHKQLKELR